MKRLLFTLILFACVVQAQSLKDKGNSSTTTLDSAATFTGTVKLITSYNSISVSVISDSAGTLQVQFGELSGVTFTPVKYYFASYTANDTLFTKHYPVEAPYFRVLFTSSADTQNTFILTTMLHQSQTLGVNENGDVKVNITTSALPSGAATDAKLDSIYNYPNRISTITATIDSAASTTDTLDLGSLYRLISIQMPAAWTAANLTFKTSPDGVTYTNLYYDDLEHTLTAGTSRSLACKPWVMKGIRYLIIRSGTGATPVAQADTRTLKLGLGIY